MFARDDTRPRLSRPLKSMREYYQALKYLEKLSSRPKAKKYEDDPKLNPDFFIQRTRYLLDEVGDPERGIKIIHIAGTAGKGTVATMLHEVLQAAGFNAGLFTSPYVTSAIEEIKVNDKYIARKEFTVLANRLKPHIEKAFESGPYGGPSYFEVFFVMAMLYFKKQKCDWVVLETGLGGSSDATNAVKKSKVTAITAVDYDHVEVLGKTLQKIAKDKAGIIKTGSHFFTAEQRPSILKILKFICAQRQVPFHQVRGQTAQSRNVAMVKAIGKHLKLKARAVDSGIVRTKLPARFELMQTKPRIILDGAHNKVKMKSTAEQLRLQEYNKLILIISIGNKKDPDEILSQIIPLADVVIFTTFKDWYRKPHSMSALNQAAKKYLKKNAKTLSISDNKKALAKAKKIAHDDDLIVATGSFYLAGQLRAQWFSEKYILNERKSF